MGDTTALIYAAIPKVMAEIGAVTKSRKNPQQGYAFRGIDDMYNAVQPAMVAHGVFCCPEVTERQREERPSKNGGVLFYTTLTVRHRFYASDGSFVDVVTIGEAMDSGDKSTNKAMSAAMKYAFIELFAIPTEEEKDTEEQTHEPAPRSSQQPPRRESKQTQRETQASKSSAEQQQLKAALVRDMAEVRSRKALNDLRPSIRLLCEEFRAVLRPLYQARWDALAGTEEPDPEDKFGSSHEQGRAA